MKVRLCLIFPSKQTSAENLLIEKNSIRRATRKKTSECVLEYPPIRREEGGREGARVAEGCSLIALRFHECVCACVHNQAEEQPTPRPREVHGIPGRLFPSRDSILPVIYRSFGVRGVVPRTAKGDCVDYFWSSFADQGTAGRYNALYWGRLMKSFARL
ncbi:hypothetical protein TSAR_010941 [Trichomalopsis sarcophagae]|uniref:Uncharacterized protein n=1 Tax=Trichomalopsis sarcophagae TaxID=543379 RepID=A0A232FGD5_9HYME|nr:hypothetical protein TSAR_010941 [Trichomalopsis sarcophagae]